MSSMLIRQNMGEHRGEYDHLCRLVGECGGQVKLRREADGGWGLLITLPAPRRDRPGRASGVLVRDLEEVEASARLLASWVLSVHGEGEEAHEQV